MTKLTPTTTGENAPAFAPRPSWIQGQVIIYEKDHGPLPDVVATQGQHLVAQPHTPVFPPLSSETHAFATELAASLSALISRQNRRRLGYGVEAAEEWPVGRTPPEIRRAQKERLRAKLRASLEEDSESDIEAILDTYYPLSPTLPASKDSPSPPFAIDSEVFLPPLGNQISSESDAQREKRKLGLFGYESDIAREKRKLGLFGYAEHGRKKAKPNERLMKNGGLFGFKNVENRAESREVVHAGNDGNGTVEKIHGEGKGNKGKESRIIHERGRDDVQKKKPPRRHGRQVRSAAPALEGKKAEPLEKAGGSSMTQEVDKVTTESSHHRKGASSHDTQAPRRSERLRRRKGLTEPPD